MNQRLMLPKTTMASLCSLQASEAPAPKPTVLQGRTLLSHQPSLPLSLYPLTLNFVLQSFYTGDCSMVHLHLGF